jgi:hypothetical protein
MKFPLAHMMYSLKHHLALACSVQPNRLGTMSSLVGCSRDIGVNAGKAEGEGLNFAVSVAGLNITATKSYPRTTCQLGECFAE